MSDFLQLSVKRRQKEGFLDSLIKEYKRYKKGSRRKGNKLREILKNWLIEEKLLSNPPKKSDSINLSYFADIFMNRICEISGHAWIEFVEGARGDSIHGAAASRRDRINAHVAEFVPNTEFVLDLMIEVFELEKEDEVLWHQITDKHLVRLFAPWLDESMVNRKSVSSPHTVAGAVTGNAILLSPEDLRERNVIWFKDRRDAHITPVWQVDRPRMVIDSFRKETEGLRYSFTPEYYSDAENCVTWAARALDKLVPGDWINIVRLQCRINPETDIHKSDPCQDHHIRERGRMGCTDQYASLADKRRQAGLRRFS